MTNMMIEKKGPKGGLISQQLDIKWKLQTGTRLMQP